jgi:hypothetical protein
MGGVASNLGGCIGHILDTMSWYSWIIVVTCAAAESIWSVVALLSCSRVVMVYDVSVMLFSVESLPNRYKSTRCWGMWRINGGWLRVVGLVCVRLALCDWMSPIYGRSKMRSL